MKYHSALGGGRRKERLRRDPAVEVGWNQSSRCNLEEIFPVENILVTFFLVTFFWLRFFWLRFFGYVFFCYVLVEIYVPIYIL